MTDEITRDEAIRLLAAETAQQLAFIEWAEDRRLAAIDVPAWPELTAEDRLSTHRRPRQPRDHCPMTAQECQAHAVARLERLSQVPRRCWRCYGQMVRSGEICPACGEAQLPF